MHKINISQPTINNFYNQLNSKFYKNENGKKIPINFEKNEKKITWSKSLREFNVVINKKLKNFKNDICLEKLIKLEYTEICELVKYIDKNRKRVELSPIDKDIFLTLYSRLNNAIFIKDLDVKVCPYCNRNYILNFSKNKRQEATGQLDHFFDKKSYPYLAVSIYNLVPSCGTCNQRKSTKQENIFYPYSESFNESAQFSLKGIKSRNKLKEKNIDFFNEKRIELEFKINKNEEKVKKHIEIFNIKNLYNEHKDIVSELMQKRVIYSDDYVNEIMNNYPNLFKNREDLMRLITCGYITDEDINKRPLSKLIKDISEELGLI